MEINKITEEQYKDIWECIIADVYELIHEGQRKGASYWERSIFKLSQEFCPKLPKELEGLWETDIYATTEDWGSDFDIKTLYRVELVEKVCYEYKRVV